MHMCPSLVAFGRSTCISFSLRHIKTELTVTADATVKAPHQGVVFWRV